MRRYRDPLSIPWEAPGYDGAMVRAAGSLLHLRGPDLASALALITESGMLCDADQKTFLELAAAVRAILVENQLPPDGFRVHRAEFDDVPVAQSAIAPIADAPRRSPLTILAEAAMLVDVADGRSRE